MTRILDDRTGPTVSPAPALGAAVGGQGVVYRVWAPDHATLQVRISAADGRERRLAMKREQAGYFAVHDPEGRSGDRYNYALPDGAELPDPASRFQPEGVHGPSACVDASAYSWKCDTWQRPGWRGQSIYELHVGTFTPEGTFRAAIAKLDHVAALGVEAIQLMPVADFPGERNWGYDGVALFAPARCYGHPDDLRALVDAAHARGWAMILDVVYNHLGPDGNYLARYASHYFDPHRHTPWGQGFNLSAEDNAPVRDFFRANACYWLDEFRFDGLRLDATHAIVDTTPRHLLAEIAAEAHRRGAFLIAEDDRNARFVVEKRGEGWGLDAAWADDFHHEIRVALTGVQESYFKSYSGSAEDLADTLQHGWFYRGQPYPQWKGKPRGEPCDHLPAKAFVVCIENHDQVGNRARGERLEHLIAASAFRAASALLLLGPYPPLIFMGQEWAASSPFLYFTDHEGELGQQVSAGRQKEFSSVGLNATLAPEDIPDPQAETTFARSKLRWDEVRQSPHAGMIALYRECLRHRAAWVRDCARTREGWRAFAIGNVVALRYRASGQPDRLVISALRGEARIAWGTDERLAPPPGMGWAIELESAAATAGETSVGRPGANCLDALVLDRPSTVLLVARNAAL
ncbi:MAG TPA: malto-oligosyltrehalose trehalohydrolase [Opitutus sp.]|nr:malto-oligosyltrehalose trehalohydrolase [Opitutus sp.]